ncbi:hypothetical protein [Kaistella chaponensis]|uniref:hypothetical protein n=1 Tax=Kaistella chaponensis TaxID=713588 RepID=UPI000970D80C|nr:hypothetical protein [Kaistella chaponensis]
MNVVILNPINAQPVTVPETAVEILAVLFNIQCSLIAISSKILKTSLILLPKDRNSIILIHFIPMDFTPFGNRQK